MPPFLESFLARAPFLRVPARFGWRWFERWNEDSCALMAAAMAYYGLLSVFPLVLAGVALVARFLAGDALALRDFSRFVAGFFPGAAGATLSASLESSVHAIAQGPSATTVSVVALGSLLWSGRAYFDTLASVLSRLAPGARPRSFLGHQLTLWGLLLGVGALFLLSTGTTFALALAQTLAQRRPALFINGAPLVWELLGRGASYALTLAMFYLLYRFAPNRSTPPRRRPILIAAVTGAVGWEGAKWAFARFLGNVARYEATYGGVAGVIVTMAWIYLASVIVLAGAEVGATAEELRAAKETA